MIMHANSSFLGPRAVFTGGVQPFLLLHHAPFIVESGVRLHSRKRL